MMAGALAACASAASLCTNYGTLDLYVVNGFSCQVDNFVFSNFVYTGSMAGNPVDTASPILNPFSPNPDGTIQPANVTVLADQGGKTGALEFRAVWYIAGGDTDPTSTPPPGGINGPLYETLDLSFTVTPLAGHFATDLLSFNQGQGDNGGTLTQSATCNAPCTPGTNYANSTLNLGTPVSTSFTVHNDFTFTANNPADDSHLAIIQDAVLENSSILMNTPEPGTLLLGFSSLLVVLGYRKVRKA